MKTLLLNGVTCYSCSEVVEDVKTCDVCGYKVCLSCFKENYKDSGINVCQDCIDNDAFVDNLIETIYERDLKIENLKKDKVDLIKDIRRAKVLANWLRSRQFAHSHYTTTILAKLQGVLESTFNWYK